MAKLDLHCHSTASDGALPPAELVARAAARGSRMLALTDHDCTAGLALARQAAEQAGLDLINGVEISVSWQKRAVHIVGLDINPDCPALMAGLHSVREGRVERARRMGEALAKIGIHGAFDGALQRCGNPEMIGRTHFARFLVDSGEVKNVAAVFRKYLVKGKPGYVAHEWATLADAVSWIRQAGGIAVIAHPGRYEIGRMLMEQLVEDFKAVGGEAIEVVSASHTLDQSHKFALLAARMELLASAGSDFHAPGEGGRDVGLTANLPPICVPVWSRFSPPRATPSAD